MSSRHVRCMRLRLLHWTYLELVEAVAMRVDACQTSTSHFQVVPVVGRQGAKTWTLHAGQRAESRSCRRSRTLGLVKVSILFAFAFLIR